MLSRYDMMVCGSPKCTHTCSKKSLDNGLDCDTLLAGDQNGHLRELINNHEYTVISMLGGGET
jgi:hypothetical protein